MSPGNVALNVLGFFYLERRLMLMVCVGDPNLIKELKEFLVGHGYFFVTEIQMFLPKNLPTKISNTFEMGKMIES